MAKHRHLSNAPIAEALIDLKIKPQLGDEVLPTLESIKDDIGDLYPICGPFKSIGGEFHIKEGAPKLTSSDVVIEGYIFKTKDEKQLAQFRKNGFTFNKLYPYTCWEDILEEALRLWKIYLEKASPETVTRIAVRYINKMELPLPALDFSEYLIEPPKIADGIPNKTNSYYSKIVIWDDERDLSANMIQLINRSADPDKFILILDNDVYKISNYKAQDLKVWEVFSNLRDLKNTIFFASIQEKTARLFE